MCGIAGFIDKRHIRENVATYNLNKMTKTLLHRGPDDFGTWVNGEHGVGLGHRRLSIIELSHSGSQPMRSRSGRYIISFNGEIYNHLELRQKLPAYASGGLSWNGFSDTETLLALIEEYGFELTLKMLVGMFSFALWDEGENILFLARDRFGEKPLYYGRQDDIFFFSSELKAIRAHPDFEAKIDGEAVGLFFKYNYVPAPHSIYGGIKKLPPGCFIKLGQDLQPSRYWSLGQHPDKYPVLKSEDYNLSTLEALLETSVKRQMRSDVPIGAFLSGGIDSSLIVAMMQEQSFKPIKTFTVGFSEQDFDESTYAQAISNYLGTDHHQFKVSANDALDILSLMPVTYDEPFADSSQIPTFILAKKTKKFVSVALSGDAGDELFGGYNRYTWGKKIWNFADLFPYNMRSLSSKIIKTMRPQNITVMANILQSVMPPAYRYSDVGNKLQKISNLLLAQSENDFHSRLVSPGGEFNHHKKTHSLSNFLDINIDKLPITDTFEEKMMFYDLMRYLPDDLLVKNDRAAMAVSLETRMPFLDVDVAEFGWSLPLHHKIRGNQRKWCLKQLLAKKIPPKLFQRPKVGFGIPLDNWLRNEFKDWAEELLSKKSLSDSAYLDTSLVREKWKIHLAGQQNNQSYLWSVLMFEAWRKKEGL
jgi:asparagine synthase (glutamine-hydrolysing)